MIEINLLPQEHRPVERTPMPRMLTILLGVLLAMVEAVVLAWLLVVIIPGQERELRTKRETHDTKKKQADYINNTLQKELDGYKHRENVLRTLFDQRIRWSRLLDRLVDARMNATKAGVKEVVLTELKLKKGQASRSRGATVSKQLVVKGYVPVYADEPAAGAEQLIDSYTKFVDILGEDELWAKDFEKEPDYRGHQMSTKATSGAPGAEDDGLPTSHLAFEVIFTFKAPAPQKQPRKAPVPATPANP